MRIKKGPELYRKAKMIIPGGTQLISKRAERFLPDLWPSYYRKAKGCKIWDLDGNQYLDFSLMGVGTAILGYSNDEVDKAVIDVIRQGNMTTLIAPEEVYLAEKILNIHPWADMVRYAKTGGEAMAIAVRIARAKTKKDVVLFCGYHGWHDWYISANLNGKDALAEHLMSGIPTYGIPKGLKGTAFPFKYNDEKGLKKLVDRHKRNIGAIVMEPIRNVQPEKEFIDTVNEIKDFLKVPLVVDEITAGFRLSLGGAHKVVGLHPDIAVFGKAVGNGYPISIIIGKSEVMSHAQNTFISSTYWTERIGLSAALKTIEIMEKLDVPKKLIEAGKKVKDIWREMAEKFDIQIKIKGIDPLANFVFEKDNLIYKTLFTQFMLEYGFLASTQFYASLSHKEKYIKMYREKVDMVFSKIKRIMEEGKPEKYIRSRVCEQDFTRKI